MHIATADNTIVASYTYDAWGNIESVTGTLADTVGTINPIRYRGYYYDNETGLYYLNARYYDSRIGRFINSDIYISTDQDIFGNNMFAYCANSTVCRADNDGMLWKLALAGGGGFFAGLSASSVASSILATISAITPVGWVAIGTVVTIGVVSIGISYAQANAEEKSNERVPHPIGRRNNYKSKKLAKEAAKKAGGGKEPIHHPKGCHGNKKPHYHPNVEDSYRKTPNGASKHDHYYYP